MLETIKIVSDTELGYMVINLSDYDKNIHRKYGERVELNIDEVVKKTRSKKLSVDS